MAGQSNKKHVLPEVIPRHIEEHIGNKFGATKKKVRRSKKKYTIQSINIVYSNIQGFTKKKESLCCIMDELECDLCLLAETMVCKAKVIGCRCITAQKSIGQNVCIVVREKLMHNNIVKLYEPNPTANMLGIRIDLVNASLRIFTAHFKQQSTSSRDDIVNQFEEMRLQFQNATCSNEGMLMVFDANVHLGTSIKGCKDSQDWGGKLLWEIVREENLVVLNNEDICNGIITRVDPRNGNGSTIDLAICNQYLVSKVCKMNIDQAERYRPTNYSNGKKTDHNTIFLNLKIEKSKKMKPTPYVNYNNKNGQEAFKGFLQSTDFEKLIRKGENADIDQEYRAFKKKKKKIYFINEVRRLTMIG